MHRHKVSYRDFVKAGIRNEACDTLAHAVLGLCGEAGEVANEFKKQYMYNGGKLDTARLVDELGDVRWYLELACIQLGIDVSDLEAANTKKLVLRGQK